MKPLRVMRHTPARPTPEAFIYRTEAKYNLNVGSAGVRLPGLSVNLDIVDGPDVDVVGDAQDIPYPDSTFEAVVMNAVLQHCEDPQLAINEAIRVLRPGGWLFVDAPMVQHYCHDTPDLWRFTRPGLMRLCRELEDVECNVSLAGISAIGFFIQRLVDIGPRPVSFTLRWLASVPFWFLAWTHFGNRSEVAGAHYLVGRKATRPLESPDQRTPAPTRQVNVRATRVEPETS